MSRLIVIGGGARSGKSRFALAYAARLGACRLFLATAQASDEEMRQRIARHREERGRSFTTREVPTALPEALRSPGDADVVLVDCLTLWISNLLLSGASDEDVEADIERLLAASRESTAPVILVSNEVGLGIVPDNALARRFRDLAGRAHQRLAAEADEVYFGAMGLMLRLVPGPVSPVLDAGDPAS